MIERIVPEEGTVYTALAAYPKGVDGVFEYSADGNLKQGYIHCNIPIVLYGKYSWRHGLLMFYRKEFFAQENILMEADRLVSGDRRDSYKHPLEDYTCTAAMWSAMILKRYDVEISITPDFACLMMAAMKISRRLVNINEIILLT